MSKRRRDQRNPNPQPLTLQERDGDIAEAVYFHRALRQNQIQQVFFGDTKGARAAAQRRLVKLYDHHILDRRFLPVVLGEGRSPTIYITDRESIPVLHNRGYEELTFSAKSKKVTADFLAHTLEIADVWTAVTIACHKHQFELVRWDSESQIKADYDYADISTAGGKRLEFPVVPDGYFSLIAHNMRHHFFLELDRGKMTVKRFKNKIRAYIAYIDRGGYQRRYQTRSLRILTVTSSKTRLKNLKAATEDAGGKKRFWFTTLGQVYDQTSGDYSDPLRLPIWQVATQKDHHTLIEQAN